MSNFLFCVQHINIFRLVDFTIKNLYYLEFKMSENEVVSAPPEKIEMEVFSDSITMNGVTSSQTEERNVNDSSSESDSDSDDGICVTADPITGPTSINLTNVSYWILELVDKFDFRN